MSQAVTNLADYKADMMAKCAHLKHYFEKPFIVMDTEFTSWEGAMLRDWSGPNEWREMGQIAAVEIDPTQGFKETAHFDVLVKPQWNAELSPYFSELTAISQADIESKGLMFAEAADKFAQFINGKDVWSYGGGEKIFWENCMFYNTEFKPNCNFFDARLVVKMMGDNPGNYSSGTLYKAAGINMDGHVHNALHDCRSVGQYLKHHFG
ncbi:MAG: hypothetical protein CMF62_10235 [Magnetococcales bacterium]|nr:hypothetical protein [Magnetococcales bacterium]